MLYGDTYLRIDYAHARPGWRQALPGLMTVLHNAGRWDTSNADFDGRWVRLRQAPPTTAMQWIDYGLGGLSDDAVDLAGTDPPTWPICITSSQLAASCSVRCHRAVLRDRHAGGACRNQRLSTLPVRLVDRVWLDAAPVWVQMLAGVARRRGARLVGGRTVRNNDRVRMGTAVFESPPLGERGRSRAPRTPLERSSGAAATPRTPLHR